ncbi:MULTISPECIES: Ig-like domain-containing protein [Oxalobacteraceae]|uniref:Ig-like domain-containing protein n=1 Tax=Herminiimonas sp. Marseille-P9896 TaxID=2742211 RepID=UPI00158D7955|nr:MULTISPECIES: Ig-like domain-containing protein [Oxalobacteraceae]
MNQTITPLNLTAAALSTRRPLRRASQLMSLEQRFMFDGAVADAAHAATPDSAPPPVPPAVTIRAAEPAKDDGKKEVVLVDTSLANYKTLEAGIRDGVGIVEFDGSRDGLAQIAQWAASQNGLDAIHILSHGSEGTINLGTNVLTASSLNSAVTQAELAQLGQALSADGDLLLYGCDVAAGTGGAQLIDGIARATGADVAASTDLTGASRLGGDWTLEAHSGAIDAHELALMQYDDVLTTVSIIYGVDGDENIPKTSITKNVGGQPLTFSAPYLYILNTGGADMGLYPLNANAESFVFTISIKSGYTFDMASMLAHADNGTFTMQVTDINGNVLAPVVVNGVEAGNALSSIATSLNDIRSVTFTGNAYATFQNFEITDVKALPPPTIVVNNDAHLSADTGTSNTDFITKTAAQTITGTLSGNLGSGERIEVSYDNGSTWNNATSYAVGSSTWSTTTTLSGSNTFMARVTNGGSTSTAFSHTYTLDTTAPTITFSGQSLSSDTGTLGTDFITQDSSQTITATLSSPLAGTDIVWGSIDNGAHWTDITNKVSGTTLTWDNVTLTGSNTLQLKVTDAAGNDGTVRSQSYTVDSTPPTTTFGSIALSSDTGVSNTDFITNSASQTISATLSSAPVGGDVVWGSVDGGAHWTNITSKVSGTSLNWNGATLGTGANSIMFKVTDEAGNDSALSFRNYTLDTSVPTTTVATASFSGDTGTSPTDFITNQAAQTISGTLSANLASGETVYVSLNNGSTWTAATAAVGQNTWSLPRTLTGNGTLLVRVSDTAGNVSTALSQAYQYDTTSPTTTFSGLSLSADTGGSNSDFITKTASQTIGATLSGPLAAGDILYGSLDNGATWTDITSKVSSTSLSWDGATLIGSNTLQLKVVDAAGNQSTPQSKAYTLDTSAPATPGTPDLATSSDTGPLNNDNITLDTTPTLSGTAENGSTVTLYDGATMLGTVVAGAGGWTYTTGVLTQGSHTITAVATDTAGNVSAASSGLTITIDTTAPTVTSVAVPANGTYSAGGTLEFTVNFSEAVIVDTFGGTPRIALVVGSTTRYADYVSGSGSSALLFRYIVPSGDIDANGITIGALSTGGALMQDAAGNDIVTTLNSVGSTAAINVDGTNPAITSVGSSTSDGAYGAGSTITITVDFSTAINVDTTFGTPTLALASGGTATYTGGSGTGTLTFSYTVGAGENSADLDYSSAFALALNGASIIDAGGSQQSANIILATPGTAGSLGANKDIVIDTSAPTNTVASAAFSDDTGTSGSDFITKTAAQTISGTLTSNLAAGERVYVSLDNGATWTLATATVGANTWSLANQTLNGSGTLKVRISDDAGNNGTPYSQAYVLDTTAPSISFSDIALSADTGSSATDLITNTAAQTISATLSAAPAAGDVVYGSLDNGATWTDITSKVSGTTLTWNGVTLAASDTLQLRVTDAAGNNGTATSRAYVLDTTGPMTSVASISFSADSGASSTDFITNVAAQTISGTLSANLASGETVQVSLDNGATWIVATATVGTDTWSLSGQTLSGSNTLLVKVVDIAGNDGNVTAQAYVYDTAASVPTVDTQSTTSLTPVLTGSATLAAGETMTVTVGGATYNVTPVAGSWTLDLATAVPVSGTLTLVMNHQYSVVATITDLAGNTASDSSANELTVGVLPSTAPPPLPVETQTPPPQVIHQPSIEPPAPSGPGSVPAPVFAPSPSGTWSSVLNPSVSTLDSNTLSSPFDSTVRAESTVNSDVLLINSPIADLSVSSGSRIAVQIPGDAFISSSTIELSATQANGMPLPGWLQFNSRTGRFEGTPPPAFEGTISFKVVARDAQGRIAVQTFKIVVTKDGQGNKGAHLERGIAEPIGRASLTEQMRTTREAGAERLAVLARSTTGARPGA